ncbi:hypothetical protein EOD42_22260 [Rhodovarius crocodyli]|uniref:Uncharacterized protein n=1 Tax=Rhodovarius crocodyli TaxID=1979269 RepID=A0A437M107_9PROT|nr:hypothetical protein [Rhodovarius crocodyli]RVT91381.1 hypothetical protein EOD42_22260 [Rhodovarius crocodyli]
MSPEEMNALFLAVANATPAERAEQIAALSQRIQAASSEERVLLARNLAESFGVMCEWPRVDGAIRAVADLLRSFGLPGNEALMAITAACALVARSIGLAGDDGFQAMVAANLIEHSFGFIHKKPAELEFPPTVGSA